MRPSLDLHLGPIIYDLYLTYSQPYVLSLSPTEMYVIYGFCEC